MRRSVPCILRATLILTLLLSVPSISAQLAGGGPRHALVIGNGNYVVLPALRNPVNDATDIAAALRRLGFSVILKTDADRKTINQAIVAFRETLAGDSRSEGVFYFAGHGVQSSKGQNFLMPVDAVVKSETDLEDEAVRVQKILDSLDEARNRVNLVILDACRDNPLPATTRGATSRGLAVISQAPPETVILYSTAAGQAASDGIAGSRNSPFTAALLRYLDYPDDITRVIKYVTGEVKETTPDRQTPFIYSNLSKDFALNETSATGNSHPPSLGAVKVTGSLSVILVSPGTLQVGGLSANVPAGTVPVYDLAAGPHTVIVRYEDGKTESQSVIVPAGNTAIVSFKHIQEERSPGKILREEVFIKQGAFLMGNSDGGDNDAYPIHSVTVSSFWMMKTEVTVKDFRKFCSTTGYRTTAELSGEGNVFDGISWETKTDANWKNPYFPQTENNPVTLVSWFDAIEYANWLSAQDGLRVAYRITGKTVEWDRNADGWRLPTEAEWEFAARGGARSLGYTYAGGYDVDTVAWYSKTSEGKGTRPVGTKVPNELGLYDMSGNVWEWCWDWFRSYESDNLIDPAGPTSGKKRIVRGGAWMGHPSYARSTFRNHSVPDLCDFQYGFRLVRSLR